MYLQDISELVSRLYPETAARCRIHRITRRRGLHHAGRRGPKRYARSCWLSGIGLEIAPHLEAAAKQRMAEGGKQAGRGRPKKVPTPVGRLKRDALIASTIKLARPPVSATAPSARRRKLRRTLAHTRKGVTAVAVGQVRPQAPAATAARMRDIQNAVGPRRTHVGIMPTAPASHGENRGSSPLGSANEINYLQFKLPSRVPVESRSALSSEAPLWPSWVIAIVSKRHGSTYESSGATGGLRRLIRTRPRRRQKIVLTASAGWSLLMQLPGTAEPRSPPGDLINHSQSKTT
jgi:hypothetical protein